MKKLRFVSTNRRACQSNGSEFMTARQAARSRSLAVDERKVWRLVRQESLGRDQARPNRTRVGRPADIAEGEPRPPDSAATAARAVAHGHLFASTILRPAAACGPSSVRPGLAGTSGLRRRAGRTGRRSHPSTAPTLAGALPQPPVVRLVELRDREAAPAAAAERKRPAGRIFASSRLRPARQQRNFQAGPIAARRSAMPWTLTALANRRPTPRRRRPRARSLVGGARAPATSSATVYCGWVSNIQRPVVDQEVDALDGAGRRTAIRKPPSPGEEGATRQDDAERPPRAGAAGSAGRRTCTGRGRRPWRHSRVGAEGSAQRRDPLLLTRRRSASSGRSAWSSAKRSAPSRSASARSPG